MKGAGKIISGIFVLSLFFVLYVREQVALLHVSYQIEAKSDKVAELSEEYRRLRFEVDQLKAPRLLEEKMNKLAMELTLPHEIRVVRMPQEAPASQSLDQLAIHPTLTARFANLLGRWIDVAQAKTDN